MASAVRPGGAHQRRALIAGILCFLLLATAVPSPASESPLRIGLTPVFLDDQLSLLQDWRDDLQRTLGRPVRFVQRTSYREIMDLIVRREIDAAWICGAPYVRRQDHLELLVVPVFDGAPRYRSYLIVSADDEQTEGWQDLQDKVFAYADPDSNSGSLYPRAALKARGLDPGALFRESFHAWGHRNVVEAVASGLADAGAVDGYVWETLQRFEPELTRRTRVVERSRAFGFPPIVVREGLPRALGRQLQSALLSMDERPRGRELLQRLNLDGFTEGNPGLFRGIALMAGVAVPP